MSTDALNLHIPQWDMADRMRKTLREAGLTSAEIADEIGVSRNTVSNWVYGRTTPRLRDQRLWSIRFGVPLEWLQTGHVAPNGGDGERVLGMGNFPQDHSAQIVQLDEARFRREAAAAA